MLRVTYFAGTEARWEISELNGGRLDSFPFTVLMLGQAMDRLYDSLPWVVELYLRGTFIVCRITQPVLDRPMHRILEQDHSGDTSFHLKRII